MSSWVGGSSGPLRQHAPPRSRVAGRRRRGLEGVSYGVGGSAHQPRAARADVGRGLEDDLAHRTVANEVVAQRGCRRGLEGVRRRDRSEADVVVAWRPWPACKRRGLEGWEPSVTFLVRAGMSWIGGAEGPSRARRKMPWVGGRAARAHSARARGCRRGPEDVDVHLPWVGGIMWDGGRLSSSMSWAGGGQGDAGDVVVEWRGQWAFMRPRRRPSWAGGDPVGSSVVSVVGWRRSLVTSRRCRRGLEAYTLRCKAQSWGWRDRMVARGRRTSKLLASWIGGPVENVESCRGGGRTGQS